jgi:hypothetical protein
VILDIDTRLALSAAGLLFLWALLLGVWKYRQMPTSATHLAHPYVDIAHRAALMYSFATVLVAVFVELSAWSMVVNLAAAGGLVLFFAAAIGTYVYHGWRGDTDNQLREPIRGTSGFMTALIVVEIGGFAVLFAGFLREQWLP